MSRFARHADSNAKQLLEAFRAHGCSILRITCAEPGAPDLLVGRLGLDGLVELKPNVGEKRRRNPRATQVEWAARWRGRPVAVVRTVDDVAAVVGAMVAESGP